MKGASESRTRWGGGDENLVKAHLNLIALLQNVEELVAMDQETASLTAHWDFSLQFTVLGGPRSYLVFHERRCRFGIGRTASPRVHLLFLSPRHCNRVFEGKSTPIPLRGLTRVRFLTKEFPRLTQRLEYYLRPTDELLKTSDYLSANTRMTLNTAAFGARELAGLDPVARLNANRIRDGIILMKIWDGPAVHMAFQEGRIDVIKGEASHPMAEICFKDMKTANEFLNGRTDTFAAVAAGDVMLRGQTPMLQHLGLILDRLPEYLS